MAQYKVPQDVEADDKLLGPFTFRQFVYLMITIGSIALCFALYNAFPLLAIIPVPFVIFFAVLALPLKKDQPMETYLTAIVSYHLKPKTRVWNPGQRESTIVITAPKQVEAPRARDISGEEASTRLSFLAGVVDTEGYSIHGDLGSPMRDDFLAENLDAHDMLDGYSSPVINKMIQQEQQSRRTAITDAQAFALPSLPANYQAPAPSSTFRPQTAQAVPTARPMQPTQPVQPARPVQTYADPLASAATILPTTSGAPTAPVNPLTRPSTIPVPTASAAAPTPAPSPSNNEVYVSLH